VILDSRKNENEERKRMFEAEQMARTYFRQTRREEQAKMKSNLVHICRDTKYIYIYIVN